MLLASLPLIWPELELMGRLHFLALLLDLIYDFLSPCVTLISPESLWLCSFFCWQKSYIRPAQFT